MAGKIILVNGASSSGKSTLCSALQSTLEEPFWHFSIDHLLDAKVLPMARIEGGQFEWLSIRPAFFEGFHRSIPALAEAGNNLIVEHIVESEDRMNRLVLLLGSFDVFFVGVHCPLDELERREYEREDRAIGEARRDFESVHNFCTYDFEIDSTKDLAQNVDKVIATWTARTRPSAFDRMSSMFQVAQSQSSS